MSRGAATPRWAAVVTVPSQAWACGGPAVVEAVARKEAAQAAFTAGLHAYRLGDPSAIIWICGSAKQGFANAQYFYATHLLKKNVAREAEAYYWLLRAADQGHTEADLLLRRAYISGNSEVYALDEAPPCPTDGQIVRLGTW